MSSKKYIKSFQRAMARNGLFGSAWLFDRMPLWMVNAIAKAFLFIGYNLTIRQRRIAKESLTIAFRGEKSDPEIRQIIKKCFYNFGKGMIELLYCMSHPQLIEEKVSFEGMEHVDQALKQGRGVIAVTAHFGNFPLMMLAFAHKKYKVSCVIRPMRDEGVEAFLHKKRTEVGLKTIYAKPARHTASEALKVLRQNEILFIPIDQNFGRDGGIFVDFFGQKAATAPGPIVFASRSKAPIIPMFIVHEEGDKHRVIIEKPLELIQGKNEEETIYINLSNLTRLIETYIRTYPFEWAWMHRRWKSKPYPLRVCPNA